MMHGDAHSSQTFRVHIERIGRIRGVTTTDLQKWGTLVTAEGTIRPRKSSAPKVSEHLLRTGQCLVHSIDAISDLLTKEED
jgi:hypothetical protein